MPAPTPIIRSFENPTLLGGLALAAGNAAGYQSDRDRFERQQAQELQFLNAELERRQRQTELDAQRADAMAKLGMMEQAALGPAGASGVGTFLQGGRVPQGVPPEAMRLQNALQALHPGQSAPQTSQTPMQTVPRRGMSPDVVPVQRVADPTQPGGFGMVRGPRGITFSGGGEMMTSGDRSTALDDYRLAVQNGQPPNPALERALTTAQPAGGFVRSGSPGIPLPAAQQLSVLDPYRGILLPQDTQMLENAIRTGQIGTPEQLINQIEDAAKRAQDATDPGRMDPTQRVMSVRDHQQELSLLRRHRAEEMANDPYGEFDPTQVDQLIQYHEQAITDLQNTQTRSGETGSGGDTKSDMVIVTNGRQTFKIVRSKLGAAQSEGFREVQ